MSDPSMPGSPRYPSMPASRRPFRAIPALVALALAAALVSSAGALAALPGPAATSPAAGAGWLWMNGPVGGATDLAQDDDATPDATPAAGDATPGAAPGGDLDSCYVPTRQALRADTSASPSASPSVAAAGTPGAGTPVAIDQPDGTAPGDLTLAGFPAGPAPDGVVTDVEAVARAVAACLSAGEYDTLNELVGDDFRGQLLGLEDPVTAQEFVGLVAGLPPTELSIDEITDVTVTPEGDATATVRYVVGNQVREGAWTFRLVVASFLGVEGADGVARASARWTVATEETRTATLPEGAETVSVTLDEYSIAIDPDSTDATTIAFEVTNEGEQDHEIIVLRLEDGATTEDLLTVPGPDLPEGITVVGQTSVAAGGEGSMVLTDLEPGDYALVDLFLDDESGVPNLSLGMEASLIIED
jgi:hypothetical protein